jgi:pyrroline-5-carboxylate reductase
MGVRYGFLGGGAMAEAIARALVDSGREPASALAVSDVSPARREALAALGLRATAANCEVLEGADVVVLAVKPPVVPQVLAEVGPELRAGQLLISIAAGVPLGRIEPALRDAVPVVRAMPNILLAARAGATAIAPGRSATPEHAALARELFEAGGRVVEVPESLLDAVTGLSGSAPAFVMVFIEALADGGVLAGLPRDVALTLATQTVLGTARLLQQGNEHPAAWKDRVATPGGTTIAGLAELESIAFRAGVMRAVAAAARRARELSEAG